MVTSRSDSLFSEDTASLVGGTGKKKGNKAKQPVSCAECRRLKLKCSREWPCTSCERRGCAQICPSGELKTGQGKRLILADTEELHQRISLLEVALAKSHAQQTDVPHPLLHSPYLFSSRKPNDSAQLPRLERLPESPEPPDLSDEEEDEAIEQAFGTLTLGLGGEASFMGSLAGSEYLNEDNEPGCSPSVYQSTRVRSSGPGVYATPPSSAALDHSGSGLGAQSLALDVSGLGGRSGGADTIQRLRDRLPEWQDEGRWLVESYWENVNWMYQVIPRPMFDADHLLNAYSEAEPVVPHKLACVYLIMALGAMFDLHREPFDSRCYELFELGRGCIRVGGLHQPRLATVQALHLCGTFLLNDKGDDGAESYWSMLGSAIKIAQRLGLHRDGETFGLSPYDVAERRQIWWELMTHDRLQALSFGRPCSTRNSSSDTKFSESNDLVADADGFHNQKYQLVKLLESVLDLQIQATPITIQRVLELEKTLQDFKDHLSDTLLPNCSIESLPLDNSLHPHLVIHRLEIRLLIAQTRLLLNRPSFARAMRDKPEDPDHGKFGQSFVTLYQCALEIVQSVRQLIIYHPSLTARWWFFWHNAVSACVCLAAITIRATDSAFASPAYHALTSVVAICKATREGCRAKRALPMLVRLQARASAALQDAGKGQQCSAVSASGEDDLSHLINAARIKRRTETRTTIPAYTTPPQPSHQSADRHHDHRGHDHAEQNHHPDPNHHDNSGSRHDSAPQSTMNLETVLEEAAPIPTTGHDSSPESHRSIATSETMVDSPNGSGDSPYAYAYGYGLMPRYGAVPPPPSLIPQVSIRMAPTQHLTKSQPIAPTTQQQTSGVVPKSLKRGRGSSRRIEQEQTTLQGPASQSHGIMQITTPPLGIEPVVIAEASTHPPPAEVKTPTSSHHTTSNSLMPAIHIPSPRAITVKDTPSGASTGIGPVSAASHSERVVEVPESAVTPRAVGDELSGEANTAYQFLMAHASSQVPLPSSTVPHMPPSTPLFEMTVRSQNALRETFQPQTEYDWRGPMVSGQGAVASPSSPSPGSGSGMMMMLGGSPMDISSPFSAASLGLELLGGISGLDSDLDFESYVNQLAGSCVGLDGQ